MQREPVVTTKRTAIPTDERMRAGGGPLRILAVSATWQGANDYAFVRAVRRAGHSVRVVSEAEYFPGWHSLALRILRRLLRRRIAAEFNAALLREARTLRYDLLFVFKGPLVKAETLRAIRGLGTVAIQFYPDTGFAIHSPWLLDAIRAYDWVFSTKPEHPGLLRAQFGMTNVSFVPHAHDPEVDRIPQVSERDIADYACDVGFVGNITPKKRAAIERVIEAFPDATVKIWGFAGWAAAGGAVAAAYQGRVAVGLEYAKANYLSRINLGLLSEGDLDGAGFDVLTSRSFHIPAAGGFMLHERTGELARIFEEGRDCACFGDAEEMIAKIRHYLAHEDERRAIAEAGHARSQAGGYSVDDRARGVIAKYHELAAAARAELWR